MNWIETKPEEVTVRVDLAPGKNDILAYTVANDMLSYKFLNISINLQSIDTRLSIFSLPGEVLPKYSDDINTYRINLKEDEVLDLRVEASDRNTEITLEAPDFPDYYELRQELDYLNAQLLLSETTPKETELTITIKPEYSEGERVIHVLMSIIDVCGNGKRYDVHEQCDDGNVAPGDGCDWECRIEEGYACSGGNEDIPDTCNIEPHEPEEPTTQEESNIESEDPKEPHDDPKEEPTDIDPPEVYIPICGNEILEEGEECDNNKPTCINCMQVTNGTLCGDGLLSPVAWGTDEECDDGNQEDGDGCDSNCKVEMGWECITRSLAVYKLLKGPDTCRPIPIEGRVPIPEFPVESSDFTEEPLEEDLRWIGYSAGIVYSGLCIAYTVLNLRYMEDASGIFASLGIGLVAFQIIYVLGYCSDLNSTISTVLLSFHWSHLRFADWDMQNKDDAQTLFLLNSVVWILLAIGVCIYDSVSLAHSKERPKNLYFTMFMTSFLPVYFSALQQLESLDGTPALYVVSSIVCSILIVVYSVVWGLVMYSFIQNYVKCIHDWSGKNTLNKDFKSTNVDKNQRHSKQTSFGMVVYSMLPSVCFVLSISIIDCDTLLVQIIPSGVIFTAAFAVVAVFRPFLKTRANVNFALLFGFLWIYVVLMSAQHEEEWPAYVPIVLVLHVTFFSAYEIYILARDIKSEKNAKKEGNSLEIHYEDRHNEQPSVRENSEQDLAPESSVDSYNSEPVAEERRNVDDEEIFQCS